jgi:hypothetical protein
MIPARATSAGQKGVHAMKYLAMILLASLLSSTAVWAEGGGKFDGSWELKFAAADSTRGARELLVELSLQGGAGTWHTQNASAKWDTCATHDAPVVVKKATDSEISFKVEFTKVLSACNDFTVKLNLVDEKNVEGAFRNGKKITGQRK